MPVITFNLIVGKKDSASRNDAVAVLENGRVIDILPLEEEARGGRRRINTDITEKDLRLIFENRAEPDGGEVPVSQRATPKAGRGSRLAS